MRPVGFIIRIYHDARSPERQVLEIFRVNYNESKHPHLQIYSIT